MTSISVSTGLRMMTPASSGEEVWLDEAARRLGVSRATLYRLVKARKLQSFRYSGDRRTYVDMGEARYLVDPGAKVTVDRQFLERALGSVRNPSPEVVDLLRHVRTGAFTDGLEL